MYRGTTPTLEFTIPFDTTLIGQAYVTLCQNGVTVLEKDKAECSITESSILVPLTQRDTLALKADTGIEVQLRVLTVTGDALVSKIYRTTAERILKEGEIL